MLISIIFIPAMLDNLMFLIIYGIIYVVTIYQINWRKTMSIINKKSSVYTISKKTKKSKRTQQINRLKRKIGKITNSESFIAASFAFGALVGMIAGIIAFFLTPVSLWDTLFMRFLFFMLHCFGGMAGGAGIIFIMFLIGMCVIAIAQFISELRG